MTDADLILALRQRGWTDCADAIEAGQRLEAKELCERRGDDWYCKRERGHFGPCETETLRPKQPGPEPFWCDACESWRYIKNCGRDECPGAAR